MGAHGKGTGFDPSKYLSNNGRGEYLEVKYRLLWLRQEHPDAYLVTEHIEITPERAIFKAVVSIPDGGSATGYGSETARDFGDFLEKAETKAIGRALQSLGFGTQFAGEPEHIHEDGYRQNRPVDSPVERPRSTAGRARSPRKQADPNGPLTDQQRKAITETMKSQGMTDDEFTPWLDDLVGKRSLDALAYTEAARVLTELNKLKREKAR